ncbi:MAG: IS1634 family transposase [Actinomyces urogenitalis]|nr:IS1634 family transposase [Actinomyces urogenitalis]MDY3679671.1 IS1634 family transposase [Actinomyces urogenitalis]
MFVRKVKTSSGATAVQVAQREAGRDKIIKHIGSAHTPDELALLVLEAKKHIQGGQLAFDLDDLAGTGIGSAVAESHASRLLWQVLEDAWQAYGFASVIPDEAFKQLVLARLIKPTSKLATVATLEALGIQACSVRSYYRSLQRASERDYRSLVESACVGWAMGRGDMSLLLYDVTTLYFEAENEDTEESRTVKRRVGVSKERRVDPQIVVGLLVDRAGNPLRVRAYSGNQAEKNTIVPLVKAFMDEHDLSDFVVVADAGMLSRANLLALEEAGIRFIVGARQTRAPLDLESHYRWHGDTYSDGQVIDTLTPRHANSRVNDPTVRAEPVWEESMSGSWRAVWQYTRRRWVRDMHTLKAQRNRAMSIINGDTRPKNTRFVQQRGGQLVFNQAVWERAVAVAGLKGYVTNIPASLMPASEVIASYHDLWHVEQSFRMSKTDLKARPIFHHSEQAIEAHLTIVIAALALSRYLHTTTGITVPKIVRALEPLKDTIIRMPDGRRIPVTTAIPPHAQDIIDTIKRSELTH